jgi:hypothetical protein
VWVSYGTGRQELKRLLSSPSLCYLIQTISMMPSKLETSGHGSAIQSLSLATEVISPKDPSLAIAALLKDLSLDSQGLVLPADRNIVDNCSVMTDSFEYTRLRETRRSYWWRLRLVFFFLFFFFCRLDSSEGV